MEALAALLESKAATLPVVVGFDGFIDEILSVVGERRGPADWTPLATIGDFAAWAAAAAGRSGLREVVVQRQEAGGCAINLGDGLAAAGVPVHCFATLGAPAHPAFKAATSRFASTTSWGSVHGRTLAFEFGDGKLMLSATAQLAELDPALLAQVLADGAFARALAGAGLLACTNWTLYPHMTEVWRSLQAGPLAALARPLRVLIDLVDPAGRSEADLREALAVARGFAIAGPVTLGLNLNEANRLARLYGIAAGQDEAEALARLAQDLRRVLGVDEVVIHAVRESAVAGPDGVATATGWWCAQPRRLTGAGDRFNAGYALGHLLGRAARERLLLGNAASGFFVRQARSASRDELAAFLRAWHRDAALGG
jgi:sugar/nucleoside kinase (ribokinase family)